MTNKITKRQKELLSIIYQYIKDTGYPPSFFEMKEGLGVSSNQSVMDLLKKLEEKKLVKRREGTARSIVISPLGYEILGEPLQAAFLGATSAGVPFEAVEISGEWQILPTYKVDVKDAVARFADKVFLLKIYGDSMIGAGIEDGDIVLVKSQKEFVSGDIVLAQIGDESTVKRFISEDKSPSVYLKPENPKYPNIPFDDDTELVGKVLSVLRNGYWRAIK